MTDRFAWAEALFIKAPAERPTAAAEGVFRPQAENPVKQDSFLSGVGFEDILCDRFFGHTTVHRLFFDVMVGIGFRHF